MTFRLTELSIELILQIIHFAALPTAQGLHTGNVASYATASALASVSSFIRSLTMPNLLHTVIICGLRNLESFIQAIYLQREHKLRGSRLALDYSKLVRRFWSTGCIETLVDQFSISGEFYDYPTLYAIICRVDSLGMDFHSLHLLYSSVSDPNCNPSVDWFCRKVTLSGAILRWNPLTSSSGGLVFLSRITRLNLWVCDLERGRVPDERLAPIPSYVRHVPFALMPCLKEFACPWLPNGRTRGGDPGDKSSAEVIVFGIPEDVPVSDKDALIRHWTTSPDPSRYGVVVTFEGPQFLCPESTDIDFQLSFFEGEDEGIWNRSTKKLVHVKNK